MKHVLLALLLSIPALCLAQPQPATPPTEGVEFQCASQAVPELDTAFSSYLSSLDIPSSWVQRSQLNNGILYTLVGPGEDISPLDFYRQAALNLRNEMVPLPNGPRGEPVNVQTVSKKEPSCTVDA